VLLYVAGPLFSAAERCFNQQLTDKIEALGYRVFLPQRDGAERDRPPYNAMTREERRTATFALDRDMILACDVFLFILDGRVPDEGACVELGIAYCHKTLQRPHKRLIGLQTDVRAAFLGAKLNPMVRVPLEYVADTEEALLEALGAML
jgi:nucleoside 2-deoxyribosyltransferase